MIQAKFGSSSVAERQLEIYSTAVLLATERPPKAPRCADHLTGFSMSFCLGPPLPKLTYRGTTMKLPDSGGPGAACEGWLPIARNSEQAGLTTGTTLLLQVKAVAQAHGRIQQAQLCRLSGHCLSAPRLHLILPPGQKTSVFGGLVLCADCIGSLQLVRISLGLAAPCLGPSTCGGAVVYTSGSTRAPGSTGG